MSESNSDSSNKQVQEQQDNRIAAAPDSVNLVASRSSVGGDVNITSTDHDTVAKSFDFAREISRDAADDRAASIAAVESVSTSAMQRVQNAYGDVADKVADAYTEAKAGEQKVLVAGALLVGGIVAIQALKGS